MVQARLLFLYVFFSFAFLGIQPEGKAQSLDSLKAQLPVASTDSARLRIYLLLAEVALRDSTGTETTYLRSARELAEQLADPQSEVLWYITYGHSQLRQNQPDSARLAWETALTILETNYDPALLAKVNRLLASWHLRMGHEQPGLDYAQRAHSLYLMLRDTKGIAAALTLLCEAYQGLGQYEEALQHCAVALAITEDQRMLQEQVQVFGALGKLFIALQNWEAAEQHFNAAEDLTTQMYHNFAQGRSYLNLGILAFHEREYDAAASLLMAAVEEAKLTKDPLGQAKAYNALGKVYLEQNEFREAEKQFYLAYSYAEEINDADEMAIAQVKLGYCKGKAGNINRGREEVLKAMQKAVEEGTASTKMEMYHTSAKFFQLTDQLDSALYFYEKFEEIRERNLDAEVTSRLGDVLQSYDLQMTARTQSLANEQMALRDQSDFNQKVKIYALVAGILAIGLIAGVLYSRYSVKVRATDALERQTESINRQKEEILAQRNEIARKNRMMEEQNEQITSSIQYARNIQLAMLPEESELRAFFPESFILNAPREIVSGDIFWFGQVDHRMVLAMIDCTGHGVPGAFLTVLVNNLLNQLVLEQHLYNPAEIVTQLDEKVRQTLRTDSLESQTNGLDIALMVVNSETRWLEFTGAKMPLYYVHNYSLVQIKGDRFSVGTANTEEKYFTRQRIKLQAGDFIYMATDGFQNQFGGKDGKKFMKTQFRRLLNSLSTLPMANQKAVLEQRFETWKGEHPQTDDVLVVGLQL